MDSLTQDKIFQEKYCRAVADTDILLRRKYMFITFFDRDWGNHYDPEEASIEVEKKLSMLGNLESYIFQIEAAPTTGNLHAHIQYTFKNPDIKSVAKMFKTFPNAYIMSIDKDGVGVNAVREYCSKEDSRVSDVVVCGDICLEDYVDKYKGKATIVDKVALQHSIAVKNAALRAARKPLLDAIREAGKSMTAAKTVEERNNWQKEMERLQSLSPDDFKKEWEPVGKKFSVKSLAAACMKETDNGKVVLGKLSGITYGIREKALIDKEEEKERKRKEEEEEKERIGCLVEKELFLKHSGDRQEVKLTKEETDAFFYKAMGIRKEDGKSAYVRDAPVDHVKVGNAEKMLKFYNAEKERRLKKKVVDFMNFVDRLENDPSVTDDVLNLSRKQLSELVTVGEIRTFAVEDSKTRVSPTRIKIVRKNRA